MRLLVLVMVAGREEPQVFSIKVVPSPSMIVRWSLQMVKLDAELDSMSNAANCKDMISPSSTCIVSVFSRLFG